MDEENNANINDHCRHFLYRVCACQSVPINAEFETDLVHKSVKEIPSEYSVPSKLSCIVLKFHSVVRLFKFLLKILPSITT